MAKKNIDLAVVLHDDCDYKDWLVELKERFYSHRLKAHVPPMATCWTSIGSWDETLKLSNILILMALDFTKISVRI